MMRCRVDVDALVLSSYLLNGSEGYSAEEIDMTEDCNVAMKVFDMTIISPKSEEIDEPTRQALFAWRLGLRMIGVDLVTKYRNQVQIATSPVSDEELWLWRQFCRGCWGGQNLYKIHSYDNGLIPTPILECYENVLASCAFDDFVIYASKFPQPEESLLFGIRGNQYYKIGQWNIEGRHLLKSNEIELHVGEMQHESL